MLTLPLAHVGAPVEPHDLWASWNLDPLVLALLAGAVWLHHRGTADGGRRADRGRRRAFLAAIVALFVALVSPLDALSDALASAHMVQHVLLVIVAAPLLAWSAPSSAMLRAAPAPLRRLPGNLRRSIGLRATTVRRLSHPVTVWLLHVVTLWVWHSSVAYDATLANGAIHALEHLTFVATAVLFWRLILPGRGAQVSGGVALLLIFGAGMASVLLSVLLTFAFEPWYAGYATTTQAWGLDPLTDQHLAGALMWVPAGMVYVVLAIWRFAGWVNENADETEPTAVAARGATGGSSG